MNRTDTVLCPDCGEQSVVTGRVTIRVCNEDTSLVSLYFRCPQCQQIQNVASTRRIVDRFAQAGSPIHFWSIPQELLEYKTGFPLDVYDLTDFVYALAGKEALWWDELIPDGMDYP